MPTSPCQTAAPEWTIPTTACTVRFRLTFLTGKWCLMIPPTPFTDIIYEKAEGIAKVMLDITFFLSHASFVHYIIGYAFFLLLQKDNYNRPERRNAFRPQTVKELMRAFNDARDDNSIGVIIFTGKGTKAFCSGGDQSFRGKEGYADYDSFGRLNVLDLQVQIRRLPKPVIAMVAGYAVGGGHVLHMVCDLTIAADNAVFGQTGPKVGSVDAGYGASVMDRLVGPKRAREMWFMAKFYNAVEADKMGLVNTVVPLEKLEEETVKWCREILRNSPMAIRVAKSALNAVDDGHSGLQQMGGDATLLSMERRKVRRGRTPTCSAGNLISRDFLVFLEFICHLSSLLCSSL
ncbi:hypothetical protein SASPL_158112 [Salvia splendens]|uniref:1,4-dihydroxy-2-naphthoyl-CoA synthase n=1 Tax=Salvia splendens TaxID=180675 RepID=A0A8X8VTT7_SALSN|nr:hypothetical protein SASPL_158112 [Salvia splendens]